MVQLTVDADTVENSTVGIYFAASQGALETFGATPRAPVDDSLGRGTVVNRATSLPSQICRELQEII
jgi:hypothetical protein